MHCQNRRTNHVDYKSKVIIVMIGDKNALQSEETIFLLKLNKLNTCEYNFVYYILQHL